MRTILVQVLLLVSGFTQAQTIRITATGATDSIVKVTRPINGFYGLPNTQSYKLDAGHTVRLTDKVKTAGNISISYNGKTGSVFIEPGQNMQITITVTDKGQTLEVQGPNAAGIKLAGKMNHPFYQSNAQGYLKKDSAMAGVNALIARDINKELNPFDSLLAIKKISKAFYNSIKRDIGCYYASVQAAAILGQYHRTTLTVKHPLYKATLNKDMQAAWPKIYENFPPNTYAAGSPDFYYYAKDYVTWYKTMYVGSKNGSYQKHPYNSENRYDLTYSAINGNFTGKIKEYMLAMYLFDELLQQDYQRQLSMLYNRFTTTYPASNYTRFLTPYVEQITTYLDKANEFFTPDEHLLASSTINSFDDLVANFKGKTVFVDMWATWCGPCKAEFEFAPQLEKYLAANNVQMLYISMDKDNADTQWQSMIKYYGLAGYHVRTTDNLRNDLIKRFWGGKGYSIPRYVIIKDGAVVVENAQRPSDKQKLYDQIAKYL